MKIKTFDRAAVKATRDALQGALGALAEQMGCEIKVGSATFDRSGANCTFKVECAVIGQDGVAETREIADFRGLAPMYGLKPDDLGRTFTNAGEQYRICGIKAKSRKYPILAERERDGKVFKFPADTVKLKLEAASAAGPPQQRTG